MKKLTYPLMGAFAIAACAVLVACGGGGGGGGGTPPTTAPTAGPTLAPATEQATPTVAAAGGTVALGGVSSGGSNVVSSASVTIPSFTGAASTLATVGLQATLPSNATTPAYRAIKGRESIPYTNINPLAYFLLQVSTSITITQSPGFSVTAPSSLSGNYFVAVYDVNNASHGWNLVAGPQAPVGSTVTFLPATIPSGPFNLVVGDTYIFVLFTATATPTPSPTATPTPTQAPTATPTGAHTTPPSASPLPSTAATAAGFTPYQVANALQYPVQSGLNGAGQTVVILGEYAPKTADVNAYLAANGITSVGASFTIVPISNGLISGPSAIDDGGEATLDVETIAGLAPGATIEFYGMPDLTGQTFTNAYTKLGSDASATVMTASFGGCEIAYSGTVQDPLLKAAAGNGVVMFASSGDQGNDCYTGAASPAPQYAPGVNYPASDPYVVGVGGQENFVSPGTCPASPSGGLTLTGVAVWNDCFFNSGQGGSGGGVSTLFTPPPFQAGLGSSSTWRNVPDIAMPAEGVAIYRNGAWQTFGGTSWGSPLAAAQTAEINEYCGNSLVTPTGSNPVGRFYAAYSRSHAAYLDITGGNNQFGTDTPFYNAAAGYDNASGLGVPFGNLVAAALCPGNVPSLRGQRVTHSIAAAPTDSYGEARDTSLGFVPHLGTDMGERGSASVSVVLVMRATPTLASDESNVIAGLRAAGFTITQTYGNHMAIDAMAPATTVERYFQTSIHNINQGSYGMRYANTSPVVLPAAIARVTHGAIVDNLVIARWFHHRIVPLGQY